MVYMINYVIFDLDDTLCDYKGAQELSKNAINCYLKCRNINTEDFWKRFESEHEKQFQRYCSNEISLEQYRIERFSYDGLNQADMANINNLYMKYANEKVKLFDDVNSVLKILAEKSIGTAILTNGPSDGQRRKLECLGLLNVGIKIFISSEIGYSKPDTACFKYVLDRLNTVAENVVMVGDSLKHDYEGAKAVGMHDVLLDRQNRVQRKDISVLHKLSELFDYIDEG